MRVIVKIQGGDKLDPDVIVDPLIDTIGVAVERGRKYLYDIAWDEKDYTFVLPFKSVSKPSDIVLVSDLSLGERFFGRINKVSINGNRTQDTFVIKTTLGADRKIG